MSAITINGDTRIIGIFGDIKKLLNNPKKVLTDIGDFLVEEYEENFDSEGSRSKKKWKSLATSTQIQRARLGYGAAHPILKRTGDLRGGFRKKVKTFSVTVDNPTSYFKYHQRGDNPQPERLMIYATETVKQEIVAMFIKEIRNTINK